MMDLREKIEELLCDLVDGEGFVRHNPTEVANRILALPEIVEALRKPWDTTGVINIPTR